MHPRAAALIHELGLAPHPEGGHYREIYRAAATVQPKDSRGVRSALTTIYFLLAAGEVSRWHRVLSDEVWHLYEGGPLDLYVGEPQLADLEAVQLTRASATASPVYTVPAGWWQAARCTAPYALVGCTVAPGFEFVDFGFLRDEPALCEQLRSLRREWADHL